ncbi:hypothetical protein M378DRAFT_166672 [Amanita muscaria Koide BX008]|uniref:Uncharacterized protein n=1 Tax=Amanita muscaria (strain Koide BX008) TaxID=946122 RepID=A0A0C2WXY7_AMAMK|nr:hypothetical protein M378DRAFT_166672 [Amanita muscaria Koide BX008]
MPQPYSSPLLASVAASPSPPNSSSTNTGFSTFRSLRSLLPFGTPKISNTDASPAAPVPATPPRGSFSGFGSMRKSLARDRERKTSLTNLLPVISIDRSSAPDLSLSARRAASLSHLEQSSSSEFGEKKNWSQAAPVLRSISPGPPLSADLSTIIEADSSGISKNDPHPSPSTEGSLDLNPNQIAKQVYDAINEKDQWLAAEDAIVIDAEDTDDADDDDDENELTEVLPPLQSKLPDNASINIENVNPSIVALLSPNSLPQAKGSPAQPPGVIQRATPTSIPRLRPMHDPKTPQSSSSDTTFKAPTPTGSSRRMMSYSHSPLSSSSLTAAPEIQPTRITITTTTPEKSVLPRLFGARHHHRSLTTLTRSHSEHSVSSAPSTPSSLSNRLQVHHPTSSSSETHLRTPSPIHTVHTPQPHSPHTPQTPQLVSTQGSTTSSASTAPNTPNSPYSSAQNISHSRIPTASTGSSISRQHSESSASVIAHRFRAYHHHETSAAPVGYGRASLDSTRPPRLQPAAAVTEHHVLATSTPFRRSSEDGISDLGTARRRREREILPDSPSDGGRSASPSPNKIDGVKSQFRSRKRSMSVQESFRAAQTLIVGRRAQRGELQHHTMNGASRSHSSLSGRALTTGSRLHTRQDDEDDPPAPLPLHQRPPLHDWLGPRSVKALRAAGLLDDREREREDHQLVLVGRNSRERSGSVATSVMSGGSGKTTGGGSSGGGRNSQQQSLQQHAFGALGHGRAPSRMAFSDTGGPSSSRRASGSGTFFSHLMHSPTLTTSTSAGSREGKERDLHTSRSSSTAPTSVSTPSLVYLRDQRDRDEIQEMKERHATETGALLSALSDSQRTTRILREENHELRERLARLGDLEAVNEDLRIQMRSLKREAGELKLKLQVLGASRPGPSSRSGLSTPIPDVVLPPPPEVPEPETPKHHRRCPSDTSSIFPVLPSNMTMLMHEEDHMHDQLSNGDEQGDQTSTVAARNGSRPVSFRVSAADGNMGRTGMMVNSGSISPTTANFSMVTGSPGSLFLRPEHEVHLGDLDTFSLDLGRVDDPDGLIGSVGLDDW